MPKTPTDKEKILMFLLDGPKYGYELRGVKTPQDLFVGYSGDRRARELADDGFLDVKQLPPRSQIDGTKCSYYRLNDDGRIKAEAVYKEWSVPLCLPAREPFPKLTRPPMLFE